jgi:hypothetical protein
MYGEYEVPVSQKRTGFSGGSNVDIVGVTGSIPVTPTIQINNLAENDIVAGRFNEPEPVVRDDGVAGSNPATPTSFAQNPAQQRHFIAPQHSFCGRLRAPSPPSNPASMNH